MNVEDALKARISVRAFSAKPVNESVLRELLDIARWSPSGGNLQPWKVIAVAGAERDAVVALAKSAPAEENPDPPIYPANLWEPYRSRRYQVGEDMYAVLGIGRDDKAGRLSQVARNYDFFGAPVGLFFVTDDRFGAGQWAHLGMFMQSLALIAVEKGLATCMQEFWAVQRGALHAHFGLAAHERVYCGMALGYADASAPINRLRSARAEVGEFAVLKGFDAS